MSQKYCDDMNYFDEKPDWFVNKVKPPTQLWAQHFSLRKEQRNGLFDRVLSEECKMIQMLYPSLAKWQVTGKALTKFGIPNKNGRILKSFIADYKKSKRIQQSKTTPDSADKTLKRKKEDSQTGGVQKKRRVGGNVHTRVAKVQHRRESVKLSVKQVLRQGYKFKGEKFEKAMVTNKHLLGNYTKDKSDKYPTSTVTSKDDDFESSQSFESPEDASSSFEYSKASPECSTKASVESPEDASSSFEYSKASPECSTKASVESPEDASSSFEYSKASPECSTKASVESPEDASSSFEYSKASPECPTKASVESPEDASSSFEYSKASPECSAKASVESPEDASSSFEYPKASPSVIYPKPSLFASLSSSSSSDSDSDSSNSDSGSSDTDEESSPRGELAEEEKSPRIVSESQESVTQSEDVPVVEKSSTPEPEDDKDDDAKYLLNENCYSSDSFDSLEYSRRSASDNYDQKDARKELQDILLSISDTESSEHGDVD